ncbi:zinc-binding dehydrogenase [Actinoplanes sp. NPDC051343]|uniref:zinc-binding dehydrogenase n=1 Tax=Actinoplanes sp. NPDC051343 TaxID=3363906 RepID=UPI00379EE60E
MTRRIRAAVLERPGAGLAVEELDLADPARDEVLVRIDAAGVCHSDYHYLTGDLPSRMPVVPGHEGAGEVVAVGPDVTAVRPGDMVGLMWRPRCGRCRYCLTGRPALCQSGAIHAASGGLQDGTTRLRRPDGTTVHHLMGVSCFADYAIVSERAVVPIPPGVPADIAAITGCAVITGVGTVLNAIGPCAGQGLVVFGAGGVGLSVVMGAVLAGAYPIVAVDMVTERLQAATRLGATHVVHAGSEDVAGALADIDADGFDYAVEAIGRPATLRQAFDALRPGGTLVAIGLGTAGQELSLPLNPLVQRERRVVGSLYGSSNPQLDVPKLLALYQAGRLPIDQLVGTHYPLDRINDAVSDLIGGAVGRGIVVPA